MQGMPRILAGSTVIRSKSINRRYGEGRAIESRAAARTPACVPGGYRGSVPGNAVRSWTVEEFFADAAPPTEDDVPITRDGRRLDTPAKVIAFIDEINAARNAVESE